MGRMRCSIHKLLALSWMLLAFAAHAQSPEVVSSFVGAPPSGKYTFASWTPKTFADLMKGNQSGEAVNIVGHLFLPPGNEKVPAVVLVHGSGGIYNAELDFWPKQFNAAGIAVFTLDMFGPRGVQSTAEDQSQVPFAADTADAFAALKLLATHPRIDAKHIAIMGFSRGGIAALRAGVERIIASQKLPDGLRYAAVVPTYPGACAGIYRLVVKPGVFSKTPILFIHGDADDYTPIGPCQDYADKIGKAGTPVEFVVLEDAHHKLQRRPQTLLRARRNAHQARVPARNRHRHGLRVRPDDRNAVAGRGVYCRAERLWCRGRDRRGQQPRPRQGSAGCGRLPEEDIHELTCRWAAA